MDSRFLQKIILNLTPRTKKVERDIRKHCTTWFVYILLQRKGSCKSSLFHGRPEAILNCLLLSYVVSLQYFMSL